MISNRSIFKLVILMTLSIYVDALVTFPLCTNLNYLTISYGTSNLDGMGMITVNKQFQPGTTIEFGLARNAVMSEFTSSLNLIRNSVNNYPLFLYNPNPTLFYYVFRQPNDFMPVTLTTFKINGIENCLDPFTSMSAEQQLFTDITKIYNILYAIDQTLKSLSSENVCGRRKVKHNELIVYGSETKPGDWPWHVALKTIQGSTLKYTCGGTLIEEKFVLTAAHCVTKNGVSIIPESIGVSLGKHHLTGSDNDAQERQVFDVKVHEEFEHRSLNNDIALLKLSSKAIYNDYIQPACLWFQNDGNKSPTKGIIGTVVGWGFDQSNNLSLQLRATNLPKVEDVTCIQRDPMFYTKFLNGKKFCAGILNGTSACNGDSGGGYAVFVPDISTDVTQGSWYVMGIVSVGVLQQDNLKNVCDPYEYTLFTDVNEYKSWILDKIK